MQTDVGMQILNTGSLWEHRGPRRAPGGAERAPAQPRGQWDRPGRGLGTPPCPALPGSPLTLAVVLHELQDGDGPGGPPQEPGDGVHHPLHVVLLLGRHGRRRGRYGNRRHGAGPADREPPSRHSRERRGCALTAFPGMVALSPHGIPGNGGAEPSRHSR